MKQVFAKPKSLKPAIFHYCPGCGHSIIHRLGNLEKAYLIDDYAEGKDSGIVDLLLVGNIDPYHLSDLSRKTERYIERKIRALLMSREEYQQFEKSIEQRPRLLIWESNISSEAIAASPH